LDNICFGKVFMRPRSSGSFVLLLPTELASVEAKIKKKAPVRLFTQSHSPTTQGRGGLSTPTRPTWITSNAMMMKPEYLGAWHLIEMSTWERDFIDLERLVFSFAGWDEGDDVSGRGWAVAHGNSREGWFGFHLGDESTFKATRKKTA